MIFNGLFGNDQGKDAVEVLVSSLKDTFYTTMSGARSALKKKGTAILQGRIKKNTGHYLCRFNRIGNSVVFDRIGLLGAFGCCGSCYYLRLVNHPQCLYGEKNNQGNRMLSELKGFKQFIKVAEENKLKVLIKDDPGYFENTMGYALAFGMFDKWAKKFELLHVPSPQWYTSPSYHTTSMHNFSKSFSNSMAMAKSNMVSTPSNSGGSSGGGSSGGGFGGGGGGSW